MKRKAGGGVVVHGVEGVLGWERALCYPYTYKKPGCIQGAKYLAQEAP